MMKPGDMVMVSFGNTEDPAAGLFICDDTYATGFNPSGDVIVTRAHVLWDSDIYSTPIDQLEVINENR